MAIQRFRNFAGISYINKDVLRYILKNVLNSNHFAIIKHDKDVDKQGDLKQEHLHFIVNLNNAMTLTAFGAYFKNEDQNTLYQPMIDKSGAFDYLTHANNPEKHKYEEKEVEVVGGIDFWKKIVADDKTNSIIDDLIHKVRMRDMVDRYGRDFVINYRKYYEIAYIIEGQDFAEEVKSGLDGLGVKKQLTLIDENGEVIKRF